MINNKSAYINQKNETAYKYHTDSKQQSHMRVMSMLVEIYKSIKM